MAPRNAGCKIRWPLRPMPLKDSDPVFGTFFIRSIFLNVGSLSGPMLKCCKCSTDHTAILNSSQTLGTFVSFYNTPVHSAVWINNWLQAVMYIYDWTFPIEQK